MIVANFFPEVFQKVFQGTFQGGFQGSFLMIFLPGWLLAKFYVFAGPVPIIVYLDGQHLIGHQDSKGHRVPLHLFLDQPCYRWLLHCSYSPQSST